MWKRKRKRLKKNRFHISAEKTQIASIKIAEMVALQTKSHTLAESIILPACRKIVKAILGDKTKQEISKIPLSSNTIQRRIVINLLISRKVYKLNLRTPLNLLYKLMNRLISAANHSYCVYSFHSWKSNNTLIFLL